MLWQLAQLLVPRFLFQIVCLHTLSLIFFEKLCWSLIFESTVCKNYEVEIWRNFKDICFWNPLNITKSKPIGQIGSKEQQQQWQFLQCWQSGVMMAPAAFADQIGDAAKKLGDASYDFAKEVDWNNGVFLQAPGIRALGGWARGFAVGLGRVIFADVCLGWFLVIFLPNKIRVYMMYQTWHTRLLPGQLTEWCMRTRMCDLIFDQQKTVCVWQVSVVIWRLIIKHHITWSVSIDVAWCG